MNRIDIKEEDYKKYCPSYFGYESKIYKLEDETLLKVFNERVNPNCKLQKLKLLSQIDVNTHFLKDLVYVDDNFIGYTMQNLTKQGYKVINCCEHFGDKKIEISKLVWQRIKELHDIGIIYGDIREANILYNGKDIILCDMDNVKIKDLFFDIVSEQNKQYLYKTHFNYDLMDNYVFNKFFVGYYQKIYMPNMGKDILKKRLDNDKCRQIAHDMAFLNPNYNGELFIDHLNDTLGDKLKRTLFKK